MRTLLRIAALTAFAVVALVATTFGRTLAPNCNKALYKPTTIIITCGDANTYVAKLKWSSWSATRATGNGSYSYNTCTPSCATGRIKSYRVTATLSGPKRCTKQKHKIFSKLEVTFTGKHPSFLHQAANKIKLFCPF